MIRILKYLWINPAQIYIDGIKCSFKNISKITNIFNYKWIALLIDSLTKDSPLLAFIKNQGLKYSLNQHSPEYIEVSVFIPYSLFEDVLEKAIDEYPENIFILNLFESENWDTHLRLPFKKLATAGVSDLAISISLDENSLLISVNKSLIEPRNIYREIKALRFD